MAYIRNLKRAIRPLPRPLTVRGWAWLPRPRQKVPFHFAPPQQGNEYFESGSGGFVFGGQAPVSQNHAETPQGGLTFGGSAPVSVDSNPSTSGGFVFQGAAPVYADYGPDPSGGFVFGGSAPVFSDARPSASGGLVFGGDAPVSADYAPDPSGGLVFGGTAPASADYGPDPAGGFVFAGAAPVFLNARPITGGQFVFGGSSPVSSTLPPSPARKSYRVRTLRKLARRMPRPFPAQLWPWLPKHHRARLVVIQQQPQQPNEYFESGSGGFVFGGQAGVSVENLPSPSGGFVFGGSVPVSADSNPSTTGGFVFQGSAPVSLDARPAASGGFVFDGSAPAASDNRPSTSGGFVFDGSATVSASGSETPQGGFVFQGTTDVFLDARPAVSGGFVFGGSAPIAGTFVPYGGFVFGGTSPVSTSSYEVAAGGFVFQGTAPVSKENRPATDGGFRFFGVSDFTYEARIIPAGGLSFWGAAEEYVTIRASGGFVFQGSAIVSQSSSFSPAYGGFRFWGSSDGKLITATYPGMFYFQQIADECSAFQPCRPLFLAEFFRSLITYHFSRPEGMLSDKLKHLTWDQDPRLSRIAIHAFGEFEFEELGQKPTVVVKTGPMQPYRMSIADRHHMDDLPVAGASPSDDPSYDFMHTFHTGWVAAVDILAGSLSIAESELITWEIANLIRHFARALSRYLGTYMVRVQEIRGPQAINDHKRYYVSGVRVLVGLPDDWSIYFSANGTPSSPWDLSGIIERCRASADRTEIPILFGEFLRSFATYLFSNPALIIDPNLSHLTWDVNPLLSEIAVLNWGTFEFEELGDNPVIVIRSGPKQPLILSPGDRLYPLNADPQNNLPSTASFSGIDTRTRQDFYGLWRGSHSIICCSKSSVEAQCLAWELGSALSHLSTPIRRYLGLYRFRIEGIGPPEPLEDYRRIFAVPISLEYAFGDRWEVHYLSYG